MLERRVNLAGRIATAEVPRTTVGGLRMAALDLEATACHRQILHRSGDLECHRARRFAAARAESRGGAIVSLLRLALGASQRVEIGGGERVELLARLGQQRRELAGRAAEASGRAVQR